MKTLSIDAGTYSVKFIESTLERKGLVHHSAREFVIDQFIEESGNLMSSEKASAGIIRQYLDEHPIDGKVVYQVPNEMISARFLSIPVKNKKKARAVIPFQLEDEIPFAVSDIHMASVLRSDPKATVADVFYASKSAFDEHYNALSEAEILPDVLTAEASGMLGYVNHHHIKTPLCILDIGHTSTKAYFFFDGNLVSVHTSYIAGRVITEVISETYSIGTDEAQIYKHQNCFVLTVDQYKEVNKGQEEFARLMERTLSPLITDLRSWEIGFRVKYGEKLQNILITGGTSNIKNLANYLSETVGIPVRRLKAFEGVRMQNLEQDGRWENRFALCNLLALAVLNKDSLVNFRSGPYAGENSEHIPLHSLAYISIRVTLVTAILVLILIGERMMLTADIKTLNDRITTIIKTPTLGIPDADRRQFKNAKNTEKATQKLYETISKKSKMVSQEIGLLQSSARINALAPLVTLSQVLKSTSNTYMTEYKNSDGLVTARFESKAYDELKSLEEQIRSLNLNSLSINIDKASNTLEAGFKE